MFGKWTDIELALSPPIPKGPFDDKVYFRCVVFVPSFLSPVFCLSLSLLPP